MDIQNITPKHTLRKTVDEPDVFHGFNGRRKADAEVTERGPNQSESNGIFWITVFGYERIDELSCRIAEEIKRAYRTRNGLLNAEISADGDQICAVAKSSDIGAGICQTTEKNEECRIFAVQNSHNSKDSF